jgi:hypothetical protein
MKNTTQNLNAFILYKRPTINKVINTKFYRTSFFTKSPPRAITKYNKNLLALTTLKYASTLSHKNLALIPYAPKNLNLILHESNTTLMKEASSHSPIFNPRSKRYN